MNFFVSSHIRTFLLLSLVALNFSSCERLKQLLPKPPPVEVEQPLTEEEVKLQNTLESPDVFTPALEADVPKAEAFELNKSSLVSIMCYHDFTETPSKNDMVISTAAFRTQMQALKDAGIPVIPMSDVLAWKRGEKNIPDEAVVISMDDGWVGVHQYAFPILKEFGYPFTFYLYKNYVNRGGRSMTINQIKEMIQYGAEIGSHSVSHQALTARHGKTEEQYKEWLNVEIVESKKFLEETFGVPCKTFAYPYGSKSTEIAQLCTDAGYEGSVTVNPQKVTWDTANSLLPRFVALGDKDANFKIATSFHGLGSSIANSKLIKTDAVDEQGNKLISLKPAPESSITERRPVIEADLSKFGEILPETIVLRISGFGTVPVEYDPTTKTVRYRIVQKLRRDTCNATLTFRRVGAEKDEIVSWEFKINQEANYAPQITLPASTAPQVSAPPKA